MKIAIIGSSGFIGGNLIKEFKTDSSINILKIDKNEVLQRHYRSRC